MTRAEEYKLYIRSAAWKVIRKDALRRDGHKCIKCNSRKRLTVHHIRYPEHLGTETLDMLQTLCEDCHNILHGGSPRVESPKKTAVKSTNRQRKSRMKTNKVFAKTVRLSSPVKVFSPDEIDRYMQSRSNHA